MNADDIQALIRCRDFPYPAEELKFVETHISWLLLTEAYAYKIKKPIHYSFLDFSTVDQRRYYCEREVILNRRLTHDMYLGVLPIIMSNGHPAIRPAGSVGPATAMDYAVLMRRMDESRQMDILLDAGEVGETHIRQIAAQLAAFHKRAEVLYEGSSVEELSAKFADLKEVAGTIKTLLGPAALDQVLHALEFADRFLTAHRSRIEERNRLGFVIDGHGDLHSKNILLLDEPVIFDCIEFNDDFRRLDLLSEIAFFCMDLDAHGYPGLADSFLRFYLPQVDCLRTAADRRLFLFYKLYRANVRLKVNCLRARQPAADADIEAIHSAVRDYFNLFSDYLQTLQRLSPSRSAGSKNQAPATATDERRTGGRA